MNVFMVVTMTYLLVCVTCWHERFTLSLFLVNISYQLTPPHKLLSDITLFVTVTGKIRCESIHSPLR